MWRGKNSSTNAKLCYLETWWCGGMCGSIGVSVYVRAAVCRLGVLCACVFGGVLTYSV